MNLLEAGIYDSILFVISLIVAIIFVVKNSKSTFRIFLIIYVLMTYSSYNIMIKPIHDYNIVIPRTALFHYKLISILSIADVLMIVTFIIFMALYIKKGHIYTVKSKLLNIVYIGMIRDALVLIISSIGFFIYSQHVSSEYFSVADQFRNARGLIYITVFLFFTYSILIKNKLSFTRVFYIFLVIDFINLISGFIATLLYKNYVWQRYFMNVVVLDQDDTGITMFYATLIFISLYLGHKMRLPKFFYLVILSATGLMILTFSKGFFLYLFLAFIFVIVLKAINKQDFRLQFLSFILIIGISSPAILYFSNSSAVSTRVAQVDDYFKYIDKLNNKAYLLLGIGYGGRYKESDPSLYDAGSMKKIDIENYTGLRASIQTPVVGIIKEAGLLGLVIFLSFGFYLIFKVLKTTKINIFEISASIYILYYIFFQNILLFPEPSKILLIFKIIILFSIYKKKGIKIAST